MDWTSLLTPTQLFRLAPAYRHGLEISKLGALLVSFRFVAERVFIISRGAHRGLGYVLNRSIGEASITRRRKVAAFSPTSAGGFRVKAGIGTTDVSRASEGGSFIQRKIVGFNRLSVKIAATTASTRPLVSESAEALSIGATNCVLDVYVGASGQSWAAVDSLSGATTSIYGLSVGSEAEPRGLRVTCAEGTVQIAPFYFWSEVENTANKVD